MWLRVTMDLHQTHFMDTVHWQPASQGFVQLLQLAIGFWGPEQRRSTILRGTLSMP